MSTAHTPGPWRIFVDDEGLDRCAYIDAGLPLPRNTAIAHVFGKEGDENEIATRNANSRLIAAAPDLLEALQAIIRNQSADWPAMGFNLNAARAAITKAIGGAA